MKVSYPWMAAALLLGAAPAHAQMRAMNDPVVAYADAEALFTSSDPKLHANKQVTLKIVKELLEAGHWDRAPLYLTDRYIQHNPLAASGLKGVMHYFIEVAKRQPTPIPDKMKTPVVSVQAEGDFVTVSYMRPVPYADDPAKSYTTTWFDMWRFVDGKADEHWDPATLPPVSAAAPAKPAAPAPIPAG